jgi:hypothetical protein
MLFTSLVKELLDDLSHPIGFLQIGAIGATYLLVWFLACKLNHYLKKDIEKVSAHIRFVLRPAHFAIILKSVLWLFLIWFCQVLFKKFAIPTNLLHTTINLILVFLIIRYASFYIKSTFWSRFVYVI